MDKELIRLLSQHREKIFYGLLGLYSPNLLIAIKLLSLYYYKNK